MIARVLRRDGGLVDAVVTKTNKTTVDVEYPDADGIFLQVRFRLKDGGIPGVHRGIECDKLDVPGGNPWPNEPRIKLRCPRRNQLHAIVVPVTVSYVAGAVKVNHCHCGAKMVVDDEEVA